MVRLKEKIRSFSVQNSDISVSNGYIVQGVSQLEVLGDTPLDAEPAVVFQEVTASESPVEEELTQVVDEDSQFLDDQEVDLEVVNLEEREIFEQDSGVWVKKKIPLRDGTKSLPFTDHKRANSLFGKDENDVTRVMLSLYDNPGPNSKEFFVGLKKLIRAPYKDNGKLVKAFKTLLQKHRIQLRFLKKIDQKRYLLIKDDGLGGGRYTSRR